MPRLGGIHHFQIDPHELCPKGIVLLKALQGMLTRQLTRRLRACSLSFHSRKALMLTRAYAPQVFFLREVLVATFLLMRINQGVLHASHMKFANDITDD